MPNPTPSPASAPLSQRPWWLRYGAAIVLSAAAFAIALLFQTRLAELSPFVAFYAAVAICSWYGGFGPGLVAVLLGAVAAEYYLLEPRYNFEVKSATQMGRLLLFSLVGTLIAWLNGRLLEANERCDREARAARASEARAARLSQSNLIGVFFADHEGRIHVGNDEFLRLAGKTREDLSAGRVNWRDLTAPEHRHRDKHALGELRKSPVCTPFEKDHVLPDGTRVPVLMGCARLAEDGEPSSPEIVGYLMDQTARRRAEAEARTHERRLAALSTELVEAEGRERRRIAGVLHDAIGHTLALAKMKLELAARRNGESPELFAEIGRLIVEAIRQARELTADLSPPVLFELGWVPALRWLAERTAAQHGVSVTVVVDPPPPPIPQQLQVVLFDIARELLRNVVKHAGTGECTVLASGGNDVVRLEVGDQGTGFDSSVNGLRGGDGFGLFSIRERLSRLGGRIEISAQPDAGTRVKVELPVPSPQPPDEKGDSDDYRL